MGTRQTRQSRPAAQDNLDDDYYLPPRSSSLEEIYPLAQRSGVIHNIITKVMAYPEPYNDRRERDGSPPPSEELEPCWVYDTVQINGTPVHILNMEKTTRHSPGWKRSLLEQMAGKQNKYARDVPDGLETEVAEFLNQTRRNQENQPITP